MNRHRPSEGSYSKPFDKSFGRKADPVGGKIYDKGSAWAGAYTRSKHLTDKELQACITIMQHSKVSVRALNLTWADIDFQKGQLHITRKSRTDWLQPWRPKDHEIRTVPLPEQAVSLLAAWQSISPENCPYVFMVQERWDYYRKQVNKKKWRESQDLVNNVLRRFKTLCRKVSLPKYSIHDLRRSCITNWAKHLPIHVVQ